MEDAHTGIAGHGSRPRKGSDSKEDGLQILKQPDLWAVHYPSTPDCPG